MTIPSARQPASKASRRSAAPPAAPAGSDAPATGPDLPTRRPSRVVVEPVAPLVDAGRFPAKTSLGEPVEVIADVFTDGHDLVAAAVRHRRTGGDWTEVPMRSLGNDRWSAGFEVDGPGAWEFDVVGWIDRFTTWRRGCLAKAADGQDVTVELAIGLDLVDAMLAQGPTGADGPVLTGLRTAVAAGDLETLAQPPDAAALDAAVWRCQPREPAASLPAPLPLWADRERARFSAWYEFFPRSTVGGAASDPPVHGTLADAVERLDHIAAMGFDVVYLPPIHPIGVTKRKGPNNTVDAAPGDPGSPWGIGAAAGGHLAVHPQLGTVADVDTLVEECADRGMELALDIAFQCSPDHPWVSDHPDWFRHRPDGTVQYAENPPKRYQDIYPLDFESPDWSGLWQGLADVFRFWIDRGVRIFRVDNPHTKAFAFWEWVIPTITADHPDVLFLSEAFTRPRVMQRLAKLGFSQSYTYFAWRQSSWELADYFTELATETVDFLRPNAWPNTPDILTEQLQTGGRPAFVSRAVLAATLSANWGVYGPAFELGEHVPVRPGSEEYLDSEKYQLRRWDLGRPGSLAPLLGRLNRIRRAQPALQHLRTLRFHRTDSPGLLAYSKTDPRGEGLPVLVVVSLDPFAEQSGTVDVDWHALDLPYDARYRLVDLLGGGTYTWQGSHNFVALGPWSLMAHVCTVEVIEEVASDG